LREWTIDGTEGSHTVYMQFRGGDIVNVVEVQGSIKLDTTKPTQSAHMTKTSYTHTARPAVKFKGSDNMSPKDLPYIVVKNSKGKVVGHGVTSWKTVDKWFSIGLYSNTSSNGFLFKRGTYKAVVHCQDKAGNKASTVTLKFKIT